MRIDKLLANLKYGTRNEIKKIIKDKQVYVNGMLVKDPGLHVDPNKDEIKIFDEIIQYKEFVYFMMDKPQGVISATTDQLHKTIIDLLNEQDQKYDVFPCGRLDIDTEGLIILTNDGAFAHQLMHPKKDIKKTYYVELLDDLKDDLKELFKHGVEIADGNDELYQTKPAILDIIDRNKAYLTISEGKFHQVKRMFQKVNNKVTFLKRVQIGKLKLDSNLNPGSYRELKEQELKLLFMNDK